MQSLFPAHVGVGAFINAFNIGEQVEECADDLIFHHICRSAQKLDYQEIVVEVDDDPREGVAFSGDEPVCRGALRNHCTLPELICGGDFAPEECAVDLFLEEAPHLCGYL